MTLLFPTLIAAFAEVIIQYRRLGPKVHHPRTAGNKGVMTSRTGDVLSLFHVLVVHKVAGPLFPIWIFQLHMHDTTLMMVVYRKPEIGILFFRLGCLYGFLGAFILTVSSIVPSTFATIDTYLGCTRGVGGIGEEEIG